MQGRWKLVSLRWLLKLSNEIYLFIHFFFLYFGGIFFPEFRSNKSKSGSSIIIAYPRPMEIKLGYESGDVTMNLRGSGG